MQASRSTAIVPLAVNPSVSSIWSWITWWTISTSSVGYRGIVVVFLKKKKVGLAARAAETDLLGFWVLDEVVYVSIHVL